LKVDPRFGVYERKKGVNRHGSEVEKGVTELVKE